MLKTINSHNGWDPLQEVWLGDVYPSTWYDHLEPAVRDVFQELTEITQEDLGAIQKTIESMGITVQRPRYQSINHYIVGDQLTRPQICPRDGFLVVDNTLYVGPYSANFSAWDHTYSKYLEDSNIVMLDKTNAFLSGANVVRLGRDIVVDYCHVPQKSDLIKKANTTQQMFSNYRVHTEVNGGHLDGCFTILRPGLILANNYFDGYERNFPGWDVISLKEPEYANYKKASGPGFNGKWWDTGTTMNRAFNDHIIKHALDWVGSYTETYFELNCLVVDTANVIMLAENHELAEQLASRGITVHWVPFRTRRFWDGAMHCLTLDIRRDSAIEDYFPERS